MTKLEANRQTNRYSTKSWSFRQKHPQKLYDPPP